MLFRTIWQFGVKIGHSNTEKKSEWSNKRDFKMSYGQGNFGSFEPQTYAGVSQEPHNITLWYGLYKTNAKNCNVHLMGPHGTSKKHILIESTK